MLEIKKKVVIDEQGNPTEVIILWEDFQRIEEMLGLDLDEEAVNDFHRARRDRERKNEKAYVDLDVI
jgi:hypothetical protein